jgi:hypothetical protein
MTKTLRVVAWSAVLSTVPAMPSCGGRTGGSGMIADGAETGAGGAATSEAGVTNGAGPRFWPVEEGSAQVGDWSFSKATLTFSPATQHVVMWFGSPIIRGIRTDLGLGSGALLDDGSAEYPFAFRCAHDIGR